MAGGVIAGTVVAAISGVLLLALCVYFTFYRKKKVDGKLIPSVDEDQSSHHVHGMISFPYPCMSF